MRLLIAEILQNQVIPATLYAELNKNGNANRNDNGGLGKKFKRRTRTQDVIDALDINDEAQTVTVPENKILALYELAEKYKNGDGQSNKNENKYAICLALIFNATSDRRIKVIVLEELKALYGEEAKLKNQATGISGMSDIPILDIINLKLNPLHRTATTVVPSQEIKATGKAFQNSTHPVRVVEYKAKDFIEKKRVHVRVAGVEAFSGTMMELFIGLHQPTTVQSATKKEIFKGFVRILSEKVMELKTFDDPIAFRKWVDDGFCGAAEVDIASAFMAEDDCHKGNIGYVLINGIAYAVRIDFDRTIAPISLVLLNPEWQDRIKCQGINDKWIDIDGLRHLDGLELHETDLASLPILPIASTAGLSPDELKKHFIPNNWWSYNAAPWLKGKIENLKNNKKFQQAKFQAILEKIILPEKIIDKIAFETIFNQQDYDKVVGWMKARQEKMKIAALKLPGFIDFILTEGELAKEALKANFRKFVEKRNDIFNDSIDYYVGFYDTNFNQFLSELPRDVRPSPEVKSTPSPELVSVSSISSTTTSPSIPISPPTLAQPSIRPPLADVPSMPLSSDVKRTIGWNDSRITSLTMGIDSSSLPAFAQDMVHEPTASPQARSLPLPPKPTSSSWLKNGINFLLSLLGTGGAAALTYGLGFIGAVNIWNPIGWMAIGGAVILGAAIALGIKNKSKAWGVLGLIPGFNILGSLIQSFINVEKPSYTSVLTHSPIPGFVPPIENSFAPGDSKRSDSHAQVLSQLPMSRVVPSEASISRGSDNANVSNEDKKMDPVSSASSSSSSLFSVRSEESQNKLIEDQKVKIKNGFNGLPFCYFDRIDMDQAKRAKATYERYLTDPLNNSKDLEQVVGVLTETATNSERLTLDGRCNVRELSKEVIHLQILESIRLLPSNLAQTIYDLVFIKKSYVAVQSLSNVSLTLMKQVKKFAEISQLLEVREGNRLRMT